MPVSAPSLGIPKVVVGDPDLVLRSRPRDCSHPAVVFRVLNHVSVSALSNLVSIGRTTLLDAMVELETDRLPEEYRVGVKVDAAARLLYLPSNPFKAHAISEAFSMLDATAPNYAHWLTEVLPKAALLSELSGKKCPPILLDVGLHANIMRSLELVVNDSQKVILVPRNHFVSVDRLHHISAPGYIPFEPRLENGLQRSHGTFSVGAIDLMVEKIKNSLGLAESDPQESVLYIRRNSGARNLVNAAELDRFVADQGWVVVEPECLSFDEQVRIFHGARVVIGATGAAMANMIFCRPGTRVGVMMSTHRATPYCYWHNMAVPRGVLVEYILCETEQGEAHGVHSNYSVSVDELSRVYGRVGGGA